MYFGLYVYVVHIQYKPLENNYSRCTQRFINDFVNIFSGFSISWMVVMCLPQWLIHMWTPGFSQTPHVKWKTVKRQYQEGYVEWLEKKIIFKIEHLYMYVHVLVFG